MTLFVWRLTLSLVSSPLQRISRAKRLAEDLRDYNLSSYYSDDMDREVKPGEIMTAYGYVAEGYEYPMLKYTVISETDIFGKVKKKKKRKL